MKSKLNVSSVLLKLSILSNKFHTDRLLSNSIYLMMTTLVMSITGFVFWIVNTKFHTPEEIGLATTFISMITLITSFSMFGLNMAVVRFLPKSLNRNELTNTVFSLVLIIAFLFSCLFLLFVNRISQPMAMLLGKPAAKILFLLFIPIVTLNMITDSFFISYGKALYTLIINTIMSISKLALAFLLVSFGIAGIISSFAISTSLALGLSILFLVFKFNYRFAFKIKLGQVRQMWRFSFGNYLSGILGTATSMLMPILITSKLSPETTAYYFMPTMIIGLLLSIPRASVSSLIAEGSREESSLFKLAVKSFKHAYGMLLPASIGILFLGNIILSAFGKSYSIQGLQYLQMLTIAVLLSVPGFIAGAILNVKKEVRILFLVNSLGSALSLGLSVLLLPNGLFGLGLAAIIYQVLITFVYTAAMIQVRKKQLVVNL